MSGSQFGAVETQVGAAFRRLVVGGHELEVVLEFLVAQAGLAGELREGVVFCGARVSDEVADFLGFPQRPGRPAKVSFDQRRQAQEMMSLARVMREELPPSPHIPAVVFGQGVLSKVVPRCFGFLPELALLEGLVGLLQGSVNNLQIEGRQFESLQVGFRCARLKFEQPENGEILLPVKAQRQLVFQAWVRRFLTAICANARHRIRSGW